MGWYAVRHFIKNDDAYEERITVWQADSAEAAVVLAKAEADEYSWEGTEVLDLVQSFELDEPPANGAEVFSLIRRSSLSAADYVDSFFDGYRAAADDRVVRRSTVPASSRPRR